MRASKQSKAGPPRRPITPPPPVPPTESILLALVALGGLPTRAENLHELYRDRMTFEVVIKSLRHLAAAGFAEKVREASTPGDTYWKALVPPDHVTSHQVTLGAAAEGVLQTLCQRHRVKPESMLRAIAESMLSDACEDPQLGPCIARDARHIEETGHVPDHRHPIPPPPAFPRNLRQGKEAA